MQIPGLIALSANRVWRTYYGGRTLDELAGGTDAADSHFPEDWVASTTAAMNPGREKLSEEGLSRVQIGGRSQTLKDLIERFPEEMLGPAHLGKYGSRPQLLVKLLDSAVRLPLQAHPTSDFSKKHLGSTSGKAEAYVILACRPQAEEHFIYLGFQHPMPPREFARAVERQDIAGMLSCFEKIPVRPGDVFFVPGGLPHAIGAGIFMVEIMEPSDFVVRFEFTVGDYVLPEAARFMGRDVAFAMDMMSFAPLSTAQVRQEYFCAPRELSRQEGGEESILIDERHTRKFSVHALCVTGRMRRASDRFTVAIVTKGSGRATGGDAALELTRGDRFVVPYRTRAIELTAEEDMEVVLAFPPA